MLHCPREEILGHDHQHPILYLALQERKTLLEHGGGLLILLLVKSVGSQAEEREGDIPPIAYFPRDGEALLVKCVRRLPVAAETLQAPQGSSEKAPRTRHLPVPVPEPDSPGTVPSQPPDRLASPRGFPRQSTPLPAP